MLRLGVMLIGCLGLLAYLQAPQEVVKKAGSWTAVVAAGVTAGFMVRSARNALSRRAHE
jgi:hypothetical protein